jgi:hypothetical protein
MLYSPEPGVLDRLDLLLRVPVHVHVEHQPAEGGAQEVRQPVILHTPEHNTGSHTLRPVLRSRNYFFRFQIRIAAPAPDTDPPPAPASAPNKFYKIP